MSTLGHQASNQLTENRGDATMCERVHQWSLGVEGGALETRFLLVATLLFILIPAAIVCGGGDYETPTATTQPTSPPPPPSAPTVAPPPSATITSGPPPSGTPVTSINRDVAGSGAYEFDPDEFTFKVGDIVAFTLESETEFHTFTVDELGIDVELDGGTSQEFIFTFDKAGTFELICLVHSEMTGTITVK